MWTQVRQGNIFRSRCNYIPGMDRRRFELVDIRYMRNYTSDHFRLRVIDSGTDSIAVRQQKLGGEKDDVEDTGGFSPPGG